MDKDNLKAETLEHLRKIAQMKGITEDEAMAAVLDNYAGRYARQVESAILAVERAVQNNR